MKYYVQYTDDSSPLVKSFATSEDRDSWLVDWFLKNQLKMCADGYWVDLIFEGNLTFHDDRIAPEEVKI